MPDCCYIVAGEKSGDQLGSQLIKAIVENDPFIEVRGVGGQQMRDAALNGKIQQGNLSVMGFFPVLWRLRHLLKQFSRIRQEILQLNPRFVILIDYPDFNLRLARALRKSGYQGILIQMVMPTIWAWRKGRKRILERYYDAIFSIYPFEKKYFSSTNTQFYFVGNPVAEIVLGHALDPLFFEKTTLSPHAPLIALFPGSRKQEVKANFPLQLASARRLQKALPDLQIAVCSTETTFRFIKLFLNKKQIENVAIVPHHLRFELMHNAHVAIATSGTVTLELALFQTPSVVTYKLPLFLRLLSKILKWRIRFFSLPNLLAQEELFPEFISKRPKEKKIVRALLSLANTPEHSEKLYALKKQLSEKSSLEALKSSLNKVLKQ